VWAVLDYTRTKTIERELLLAKISILGPEYFSEQLANKGPDILPATDGLEEGSPAKQHADNTLSAAAYGHPGVGPEDSYLPPAKLTPSEALRQKHTHLSSISMIASQFQGKIVDMSNDAVIVEMTGKTARVDAFLKLVRPYGILEAARSGESNPSLSLRGLRNGRLILKSDLLSSPRSHGHAPR
jgi:acetolactate synthase-1/3 small subunit